MQDVNKFSMISMFLLLHGPMNIVRNTNVPTTGNHNGMEKLWLFMVFGPQAQISLIWVVWVKILMILIATDLSNSTKNSSPQANWMIWRNIGLSLEPLRISGLMNGTNTELVSSTSSKISSVQTWPMHKFSRHTSQAQLIRLKLWTSP